MARRLRNAVVQRRKSLQRALVSPGLSAFADPGSPPALTAEMLIELTGQSSSAAYRNIATLETVGALKPGSHINGRKVWTAPAIIEALDEFALRAGKRGRG